MQSSQPNYQELEDFIKRIIKEEFKDVVVTQTSENVKENIVDPQRITINDIRKQLPSSDHCSFVRDSHNIEYYQILGKKYHTTTSLPNLLAILDKVLERYGDRAIQAKENDGVDWKALSHAFRAAYQCKAIFEDHDFSYPLKQNYFLMQVKLGKLDFNEVNVLMDEIVQRVYELARLSTLPNEPNHEFWDNWLCSVYKRMMIENVSKHLDGITATQDSDQNGWWETSVGVSFGETVLYKIEEYLNEA